MTDIRLVVAGYAWDRWKSARVIRTIDAVSGSFQLGLAGIGSSGASRWPIREEDECQILLGGEPVITGWVDKWDASLTPTDRKITVSGRDKTGALVDNSAVLKDWEYFDVDVVGLARKLAAPFGVEVLSDLRRPVERLRKVAIDRGTSAWEVLGAACKMAGVLAIANGEGKLVIARPATAQTVTALVEGVNIISISASHDASSRFAEYIVTGQRTGGEDLTSEDSVSVRASARDAAVRRKNRVLMVRADTEATPGDARRRAEWEAIVRAGKAESVTVQVQGWTQNGVDLWPVNALVDVRCPTLGINGRMLIAQAAFSLDPDAGETTELELLRPDAYAPKPVVLKTTQWAELRGGVGR